MNAKPFNSLFDEVLVDVAGVPQPVALNAIRNAAIEFCEKSGVWVADADPLSSIANVAAYQFEPENSTEVVGVVQAWYNGVKITQVTAAHLDDELSSGSSQFLAGIPWADQKGVPEHYLIERPDEFILAPYPTEAIPGAIKMKVSLKPSRTATSMERWVLDKYFETLAHGAKGKLFAMPMKPWSNSGLSDYHKSEFDHGIASASFMTSNTQKLPAMVSDPSPI